MSPYSEAEQVSPDEIAQFQRDGVVALRQKFSPEWIDLLRETIDESLNRPSPHLVSHTKDPNVPAYYEDFWSWSMFGGFERFVR